MSIVAIVPYQYLQYTNDELELAGFGKQNFTVPAYTGVVPSHGAMHAWNDAALQTALEAIPYVTLEVSDGDPVQRTNALIEAQGALWATMAPVLPNSGMVNAGEIYNYEGKPYSVVQSFDRGVYSEPPATYPALIRYLRPPGSIEPWVQPIDQYDAYKLLNLYTGKPDRCTHTGRTWEVIQADGAGNNTYEPGVYGWQVVVV